MVVFHACMKFKLQRLFSLLFQVATLSCTVEPTRCNEEEKMSFSENYSSTRGIGRSEGSEKSVLLPLRSCRN